MRYKPILLGLLAACCLAAASPREAIYQMSSSQSIGNGETLEKRWTGAAINWNGQRYILTCAHQGSPEASVRGRTVKRLATDVDNDLALYEHPGGGAAYFVAERNPGIGERVSSGGFPGGSYHWAFEPVKSYFVNSLVINGYAPEGSSGSPVIDIDHRLCGVITSTQHPTEDGQRVGSWEIVAADVPTIRKFLTKASGTVSQTASGTMSGCAMCPKIGSCQPGQPCPTTFGGMPGGVGTFPIPGQTPLPQTYAPTTLPDSNTAPFDRTTPRTMGPVARPRSDTGQVGPVSRIDPTLPPYVAVDGIHHRQLKEELAELAERIDGMDAEMLAIQTALAEIRQMLASLSEPQEPDLTSIHQQITEITQRLEALENGYITVQFEPGDEPGEQVASQEVHLGGTIVIPAVRHQTSYVQIPAGQSPPSIPSTGIATDSAPLGMPIKRKWYYGSKGGVERPDE